MSKNLEYVYFWYHGGIPWAEVDAIEDAINDGDYKTFMIYKKKYPKHLPDTIYIFEGNDIKGKLDSTKAEDFDKITSNDHENG